MQGFREVVVHAGFPATVGIAFGRIGGHGDDRSAPPGRPLCFQLSNLLGRLVSVKVRHLTIHQDGGEFRPMDRFHRRFPAGDDLRQVSQIMHGTRGHNLIHRIVIDDQDAFSGSSRRTGLLRLAQRNYEPEDRSATWPVFDVDGAAHHGDQPV